MHEALSSTQRAPLPPTNTLLTVGQRHCISSRETEMKRHLQNNCRMELLFSLDFCLWWFYGLAEGDGEFGHMPRRQQICQMAQSSMFPPPALMVEAVPPALTPPPPVLCGPRRAVSDHLWHWASLACAVMEGKQISHAHCGAVARAALSPSPRTAEQTVSNIAREAGIFRVLGVCSKQFPSCDWEVSYH